MHEHGAELFSRGVQSNAGLGFGVLAFGVAMGALFAVAFCLIYGRAGESARDVAPRPLSMRLAAAAFVTVYLVPFVKYPPNPPAVGQSDTVGARTGWYLVMVLVSVVLAIVAMWLARRLAALFGGLWNAGLIAAGVYLVVITVVLVLLPTVRETPEPLRNCLGCDHLSRFSRRRSLRIPVGCRWPPSWCCGRPSAWFSRRLPAGCWMAEPRLDGHRVSARERRCPT